MRNKANIYIEIAIDTAIDLLNRNIIPEKELNERIEILKYLKNLNNGNFNKYRKKDNGINADRKN